MEITGMDLHTAKDTSKIEKIFEERKNYIDLLVHQEI